MGLSLLVLLGAGCAKAPISYDLGDLPVTVSTSTAPFPYSATSLKGAIAECGHTVAPDYVDVLASKFQGTELTKYTFTYTGEGATDATTYTVTLAPNAARYTSFVDFERDFGICAAGGDMYPKMMSNSKWLLFTSSCGSGFMAEGDEGKINGCELIKAQVERTLEINE